MKYFLLLAVLVLLPIGNNGNYFCNLPCRHIVCLRDANKCRLSYRCGEKEEPGLISDAEREQILTMHNAYRNKVANGIDWFWNRIGSYELSDMNLLSYDYELEFIAQCWTNWCKGDHSICKRTPRFEKVGINYYIGLKEKNIFQVVVRGWLNEERFIKKLNISEFKSSAEYNHLTQIVWARTTHIGCGRTFQAGRVLVACLYGVAGNQEKQPVFTNGHSCGHCNCNNVYTSLCGFKNTTHWVAPYKLSAIISRGNKFLIIFALMYSAQIK